MANFCPRGASALLVLTALATIANAQSITPLPNAPGWTSNYGLNISADGRTVVGVAGTSLFDRFAAAWRLSGSAVSLGVLPGDESAQAWFVSADGSRIAGISRGQTTRPWVWTEGGQMQPLPELAGQTIGSVTGISADGTIVAGTAGAGGSHAVRWVGNGAPQVLAAPAGHQWFGANSLSADGSTILGVTLSGTQPWLVRWSEASGAEILHALPAFRGYQISASTPDATAVVANSPIQAPLLYSDANGLETIPVPLGANDLFAYAISADGSLVAGEAKGPDLRAAFIWTREGGTQLFSEWLAGFGVDLTGWEIYNVTGMTPDGLTFVGNGVDPQGNGTGFVATIPAPGAALPLAVLGLLAARRRRAAR